LDSVRLYIKPEYHTKEGGSNICLASHTITKLVSLTISVHNYIKNSLQTHSSIDRRPINLNLRLWDQCTTNTGKQHVIMVQGNKNKHSESTYHFPSRIMFVAQVSGNNNHMHVCLCTGIHNYPIVSALDPRPMELFGIICHSRG
jgi:hypothetical protein